MHKDANVLFRLLTVSMRYTFLLQQMKYNQNISFVKLTCNLI